MRSIGAIPSIAGRPLVFLCPGAGLLPIRAWPVASFSVVAHDLIGRGYAVAIIGVAADRELAQAIQRACNSTACVDLTGYTETVRDVAVLLHLGVLLITNDGGTGHFASLTPIASIVLFGPETPVLYGSLSARAVNLHKPLSCSPCLTALQPSPVAVRRQQCVSEIDFSGRSAGGGERAARNGNLGRARRPISFRIRPGRAEFLVGVDSLRRASGRQA